MKKHFIFKDGIFLIGFKMRSFEIFQVQEMTVMKFVQLFILKKKLRESMVAENNNCYLDRGTHANDLLDLTCLNCKEKYSDLLEKLKIIQSFTMLPKVSAFPYEISIA